MQVVFAKLIDEVAAKDALVLRLDRDVNHTGQDRNHHMPVRGKQLGAEKGASSNVVIDGDGETAGRNVQHSGFAANLVFVAQQLVGCLHLARKARPVAAVRQNGLGFARTQSGKIGVAQFRPRNGSR